MRPATLLKLTVNKNFSLKSYRKCIILGESIYPHKTLNIAIELNIVPLLQLFLSTSFSTSL